jgi:RND superfamily putative drug exporter
MAIPVGSLRLGHADDGTLPTSVTSRRAYDLLAEGFGAGFNGPLQVVADLGSAGGAQALVKLADAVRHAPGVAQAVAAPVSPGARVGIIQVYPTSAPDSEKTGALIERLRSQVVPAAESGTTMQAHVGGATAIFQDFAVILDYRLPLFLGVIIGLGLVLLLVAFRSLAIPMTAAVMNLLGAGASFGLLIVIFQWGWGRARRVSEKPPRSRRFSRY